MKNILPLIIIISSSLSWAQTDYRPIPETDATWIQADFFYSAYNSHEHATVTSVAYTQNDTLINGMHYCKFGSHAIADWIDNYGSQQNQTTGTDYIPYSAGYFRQDTMLKKVFLWNNFSQTDELLYDFGNLIVGQPYPATVTNVNYPNLLVLALDSVELLDGNYYKRWILGTNSLDSGYVAVIEGVGGTNGFNSLIYPVFEQASNLLCHKVNTQGKYENWLGNIIPPRYSEECSKTLAINQLEKDAATIQIYPNPTHSQISIQTDQTLKTMELYNLNGQLLLQQGGTLSGDNISLDLSKLEDGMYLLKFVLPNNSTIMNTIQLIK